MMRLAPRTGAIRNGSKEERINRTQPDNRMATPVNAQPFSVAEAEPFSAGHAREQQFASLAGVLLFLGLAVILALPVFSRESWLIYVQDDLLYYLKVAQNLAHGRGSTFNGLAPTNGYQPLWFLVLTAVSRFTVSPRGILGFLAVSDWIAALATFLLARRLLRLSAARPWLVFALSTAVTLYSVTLFFYGMEVTLTVPLFLGTICLLLRVEWLAESWRHTFLLGLLLSALVLSRIDTLIFGGMILLGLLLTPALRRLLRAELILGTALGLLPLVAYFILNRIEFDTFLPISGMAKELKLDHLPSLEPWRVFFHLLPLAFTCIFLAGLALLPRISPRLSPMERIVFPSVILFPFVYYFILCCVSDWTLWGWYYYPLRTSFCISLLVFTLYPPLSRLLQKPAVTAFLVVAVFVALGATRWRRQQVDIYQASVQIAQFAQTHPGIYAMGDRAGRVAALMPDPILQTEGLMMDRPYLELIRHQTPLRQVLAQYHVRYYVATAYDPFTGCFNANEPSKAGPRSIHLRGQFCEQPQATFFHDGIETLIFDLQPGPSASAGTPGTDPSNSSPR